MTTTITEGFTFSNSAHTGFARSRLEQTIEAGRVQGAQVLEQVKRDAPTDAIVRARAFQFEPAPTIGSVNVMRAEGQGYNVQMRFGDNGSVRTIHKHAFGQLAERAGVPGAYLSGLATSGNVWERDLAIRILNDHTHQGPVGTEKLLVRSVRNEVRGILSDRFKRLDSLPLISAFAEECNKLGAVPSGRVLRDHSMGTGMSDTKVALKAILPHIFEPIPGECMALGIEWFNSDYGAGKYGIRAFILRLICLNGAVGEDAFSQIHLGGRLTEEIEYSAKTLASDTRTTELATRDHVKHLLNPVRINQGLEVIKRANEKKIDWANARGKLAKVLLKGELDAVKNAFEGQDVVNLPAGQTEWRLSNAVSWIAGDAKVDADRRLELERVAGSFFATEKKAA